MVWFGVETLMRATLYFYVALALAWAHERWLGGLALEATRGWPVPLRALRGVMVYDLVLYLAAP